MSNDPLDIDTLLSQGACCGNGCANCPYTDKNGNQHQIGTTHENSGWIDFKRKNPHSSFEDWKNRPK